MALTAVLAFLYSRFAKPSRVMIDLSYSMRVLAAAVGLPFAITSCNKPAAGSDPAAAAAADRPQPVEVMPVDRMTLRETVGLVGSIAANESAEIRPEISGILTEIGFEEGAQVLRGDVLAKLDTRELEAQLAEARARFTLAQRNLERTRQLAATNAVSKLELDAAEAEYGQLQASIDLLEVRLDKSTIVAPFDGVTGARTLSVGDYVSPQSIITTVSDLSRLKVDISVPERYLPNLAVGTTFALRTATLGEGEEITGEVYFVSPQIDETTRSTQVKGYVSDPPDVVRPGMFANISLILRTVEDALVVPETAILSTERGTVVIVPAETDDETLAEFVPVQTGLRVPGWVQVTPVGPPLDEGDPIVSSGVGGLILFPGAKLQPVDPVVKPGLPGATDRRLPAGE